ncbi:MAG TPA: hypothetical protein VFX53_17055 [Pedococcus sp.]|nr:hypothetical protein [Pedococcus sp.]
MPKINVNDEVVSGFRAEVLWGMGRYVQIGTVNQESTLRLENGDTPDSAEPFKGWFVTLDRDGCNRLIRAVRQARDSAYGADA